MARRKSRTHDGPGLFEEQERERIRRTRRQRALFIPKYLAEAAKSKHLEGAAQDRAHEIAVRWADLESKGHLPQFKETSVDTQFLDQLFVEGLGYQLKTTSPEAWQLEHKFAVTGVGTADAALAEFPAATVPAAVVELKDSLTDLDRNRSNGRTAVQQCWDYMNALPGCSWGIVSNFKTIRLYHHEKGTLSYEEFSLQELRERKRFNEFYYLFERGGLLRSRIGQQPRAAELLKQTTERQRTVGDALYSSYQQQRSRLIEHLMHKHGKDFDSAIRIAQKLLDRVIFIAFCEDRDLLKENCLERAWRDLPAFTQATNPRWHNFRALFGQVDSGGTNAGIEEGYNGNLFKHDPELDDLELDDVWTDGLKNIGTFDFSEEVNVEVLGHLFERSITELEKLRVGGLFALKAAANGNGNGSPKPAKRKAKNAAKNEVRALPSAIESSAPSPSTGEDRGEGEEPAVLAGDAPTSKMPKSAQRKKFGIYYTPAAFTALIVERTVEALIKERFAALAKKHKVDPESREDQDPAKRLAYWMACLEELKTITVCDPACGSGAFLIRAYDALDAHYKTIVHGLAGAGMAEKDVEKLEEEIPDLILDRNLYGVDYSEQAVEITQLALWIRSARVGHKLSDLSKHIVCGNSLVSDPAVDPKAVDWPKTFPHIFDAAGGDGFSCVIGNPPWERVKVQDREFFSLTDPATAEAVSASERKKRIAEMPKLNPPLYADYLAARARAQRMLDYARGSDRYPLTGKGDVNLYMLFAELARSLVAPCGLVGLLVPSGIATDDTTKDFFADLMDSKRLVLLFDFENKEGHFQDVHRSFKFSSIVFGGRTRTTDQADFVFFARRIEDTIAANKQRHIALSAKDMALLNPNTKTCPIFRTRRDADLTKAIYKRIPILLDENRKKGGNPWGARFFAMFHQTNDADHFHDAKFWQRKSHKLNGNAFFKAKKRALPLYEAKMIQAFDHRAASVMVEANNWVRQGQKEETSLVEHQNPEFATVPRWWVDESAVAKVTEGRNRDWLLAYKDVTSPTNERTMIASFLPWVGVVNSAPLVFVGQDISPRLECCLLANINSYVYDYIARQKVGGVHLNFFIVEQLPTLPPDAYVEKCPWSKRETLEHWIGERVLKLSCTAEDMVPLAKACDFAGSRGDGVHIWKESERATLRAELDAAFFHLYQIPRPDTEYILSTFSNTGLDREPARPAQQFIWGPGATGATILNTFNRLADVG